MSEVSFNGRVAVVTGSGRGMGRELALLLARRGASLVVDDISAKHADETVATIRSEGGAAVAVHESCATPEGGEAIVQRALDEFGTVDIVVHNAGIVDVDRFEDLTPDRIRRMIDVHLLGGFWVMLPAWPVMKERQYGRIVLTGSATGMFYSGGLSDYAAAKAGLWGLMKALAFEGRGHGIQANLLMPGATTTLMDAAFARFPNFGEWTFAPDPEIPEAYEDPDRWRPAVPSQMTAYLVSEECTVTGEAFTAAAGRYARCFVGSADGWTAQTTEQATPEAIREHIEQIRDCANHVIPNWAIDEVAAIARGVAGAKAL